MKIHITYKGKGAFATLIRCQFQSIPGTSEECNASLFLCRKAKIKNYPGERVNLKKLSDGGPSY